MVKKLYGLFLLTFGVVLSSSGSGIYFTAASSTTAVHQWTRFFEDNPIKTVCTIAATVAVTSCIQVIQTGKNDTILNVLECDVGGWKPLEIHMYAL